MNPKPSSAAQWEQPRAGALWMLFLGPLFFVVYGGTNWLTSLRQDVGTFYFEWETWIPFVPALIIPYMSIDFFFAGSTFLCRTREDLQTLARRIVFAILISAAGFLLFPLRFAFGRPEVTGGLSAIFGLLAAFDQPYNLVPSLHISLLAVIWPVYHRHTTGLLRSAINSWFVLVGLSTVFTYQHHVIDVLSGALVALACFYLFPDREDSDPRRAPPPPNLKGAAGCALPAAPAPPLACAPGGGARPPGRARVRAGNPGPGLCRAGVGDLSKDARPPAPERANRSGTIPGRRLAVLPVLPWPRPSLRRGRPRAPP